MQGLTLAQRAGHHLQRQKREARVLAPGHCRLGTNGALRPSSAVPIRTKGFTGRQVARASLAWTRLAAGLSQAPS